MKYQRLKKQVFTESGIVAVVIAVLGGTVFLLDTMSDDYLAENLALQGQANAISAKTKILQDKYFRVQQNADIYQDAMQKQARGALTITRQALRETFNQLNDQYYLSSVRLSLSGIDELQDPKFKRTAYTIIGGDVSVSFEGLSDEYVYNMINAMEKDLAGSSRIEHLILARQKPMSDDALRTVSQRSTYPFISGEIKFRWFGIKSLDTGDKSPSDDKDAKTADKAQKPGDKATGTSDKTQKSTDKAVEPSDTHAPDSKK